VQFLFRVNGSDSQGRSAQVSAAFRVGAFNGVPFVEPDGAWTGTITPSFVLDGSCLVGIRADFNLTRQTGFPLRTETTAGYAVAVICNKLVGCNGTGIACGATPPGGGASLLDNLDDALFS
jgi:hypothetical protein